MEGVTRRLPFYDLRDWFLSNNRFSQLMGVGSGSESRNVFYPAAQQPEGGFPYILYNSRQVRILPDWWMREDFISMELFIEDIEDSTEVLNIMIEMAGRYDASAQSLQSWVKGSFGRPDNFIYHYIMFSGAGDLTPPDEEGAVYGRGITFGIVYSPRTAPGIA